MLFQFFNVVFMCAFLLSALVQYNDPDPAAWIAIYLGATAMCLDQRRRSPWVALAPALSLICLVWIGFLLPRVLGEVSLAEIAASITMKTQAVEEAREIGGLFLVALWAAVVAVHGRRAQPQ